MISHQAENTQTVSVIDSLFYLLTHLPLVTLRPIDLTSRVYRTHQLVYRCAKKSELENSKVKMYIWE